MMEEIAVRPGAEYIPPPLPPKVRPKKSSGSTLTHIDGSANLALNGYVGAGDVRSSATIEDAIGRTERSSMHSIVLNSSSPTATVFVAAGRAAERDTSIAGADAAESAHHDRNGRNHAVTIRVNTDAPKVKAPVISSVQLKSGASIAGYQSFGDLPKKNNSIVRINVEESRLDASWDEDCQRRTSAQSEKNAPYIYCNSYPLSSTTNMVMSSGQCSPSDTLDSGTCSDLDGTPPPLPKKKSSKTNCPAKSGASVTLITFENATENSHSESNHSVDLDFEDNDSNISCDSLNSSELNGSINTEESNENKRYKSEPPVAPEMPSFVTSGVNNNDGGFLPQGLLQDIRERSAKLNTIPAESSNDKNGTWLVADDVDGSGGGELIQESAQLTSFQLVSQVSNENKKNTSQELMSLPINLEKSLSVSKTPLISESTYEDRQKQKEKKCYSGNFIYDTDKYYEFHLNEKVFDEPKDISVVRKRDSADDASEYFAGVKDYKAEEVPSTIRSSKGTIRGVKNRVRAGIATFLQIQTTTKSYKEKDAGKVVLYATTMGIVRGTYQRCVLVKKILRNLLVKYEERDVFMSTEYQDEIRDRMRSDDILVPQLFIDGQHVGDADTVEKLNESGELRKMLKPYKSADACNTCQTCGGFRLLPCRICSGSKKSLHRNHFTAEFVALKCMNCDEVGLVKCDACS